MQFCLQPPLSQALELQAASTLVVALHAFPREVDPPCERPRTRPPIPLCLDQPNSSAAGRRIQYRLVAHPVSCSVVVCPVSGLGGPRRWKVTRRAGLAQSQREGGGCSPYRTQVRTCSPRHLPPFEALLFQQGYPLL